MFGSCTHLILISMSEVRCLPGGQMSTVTSAQRHRVFEISQQQRHYIPLLPFHARISHLWINMSVIKNLSSYLLHKYKDSFVLFISSLKSCRSSVSAQPQKEMVMSEVQLKWQYRRIDLNGWIIIFSFSLKEKNKLASQE